MDDDYLPTRGLLQEANFAPDLATVIAMKEETTIKIC